MKKNIIAFISLMVASLHFYGQEHINSDGYNILYYPNGKLLSEGYLVSGKPEGYWKTYYTTGVLKSEGNRKNLLLDSVWIFYNSTGDTIQKINYYLGKKNGYSYDFNTDREKPEYIGSILGKELYINDIKSGKSYYYFNSGKLKEEANYLNNKRDGVSIEYDFDGRIITIKRYDKGSLVERERLNRYNENNEKTGIWKNFYDELKLMNEGNYENGLLDGYYKEYDKQGKLIITLLYKNGKLIEKVEEDSAIIDIREIKDDVGNILERGPYINNIPIGIHKKFDKAGNIIASKIYDDYGNLLSDGIITEEGKKENAWKDYYFNGTLKDEGIYSDNMKEGKWMYYFINGKIEQVGNYKNGKNNGDWKWFYNNGELWKEEKFYNGKEEGMYIEYDIKGNIMVQGEYYDDEKEGEWTITINDFIAKGKYVNGLRDGKWKYFYDDKTLMFEGDYIQGNPEGSHKYFYPNGTLKEEQFYVNGIRDKHWKKYNENGILIVTISYENGKEYRINGVKIDLPDVNKILIK